MASAYLPLLSCTVGAREALIAACILPFNHTHSVLPTLRTIESCNQNLSMALSRPASSIYETVVGPTPMPLKPTSQEQKNSRLAE